MQTTSASLKTSSDRGSNFSSKNETLLAVALMALVVGSRFLPHAPNFSPVLALMLFSGSVLRSRVLAMVLPLALMLGSDLLIGPYEGMSFVYAAYALTVMMGYVVRAQSVRSVAVGALAASVLFFVLSNMGVWFFTDMYEKSVSGLWLCFVLALPFFHQTLFATLSGAGVLFALYAVFGKVLVQPKESRS